MLRLLVVVDGRLWNLGMISHLSFKSRSVLFCFVSLGFFALLLFVLLCLDVFCCVVVGGFFVCLVFFFFVVVCFVFLY